MSRDRRAHGKEAEKLAQEFLVSRGLKLVEANYYCRLGELDLVMKDKNSLVFVEVRLRRNPDFGSAAESVTRNKQDKLWRAALHFTASRPDLASLPVRFDVIALSDMRIDDSCWIKNAFGANH